MLIAVSINTINIIQNNIILNSKNYSWSHIKARFCLFVKSQQTGMLIVMQVLLYNSKINTHTLSLLFGIVG